MKKYLLRIAGFLSLILFYFIGKEFLQLYYYLNAVDIYLGYGFIALIIVILLWFVFIPVFRILTFPKNFEPVKSEALFEAALHKRIDNLKKNRYLKSSNYDLNTLEYNIESYEKALIPLKAEATVIRKKYVVSLFYSSAISQNGFIDAILILSAGVNLVKEMFTLYHGRVSNRDLWAIAKRIYYSIAIGGSEGIEYMSDELFSKLATDSMKSVPFADKILGSLADGIVNAALLTRISLITENYCTKIYIKSDRELYPNFKTIQSVTTAIIGDVYERTAKSIVNYVKEKGSDFVGKNLQAAVNPLKYILEKTTNLKERVILKGKGNYFTNIFAGFGSGFFRKR